MDVRRARALLGVSDRAEADEVWHAFCRRAAAAHARHAGDRAELELVVLAYETLQHVDVLEPTDRLIHRRR